MNKFKLVLFCKFMMFSVLIAFAGTAYAEYYIVYPASRPVTQCYDREIVRPVYHPRHRYVKRIHHNHIRHHYAKARTCRSCQITVNYYYPSCPLYVNNEYAPCSCRGTCNEEYEFDMDRRTADDVTDDLQVD